MGEVDVSAVGVDEMVSRLRSVGEYAVCDEAADLIDALEEQRDHLSSALAQAVKERDEARAAMNAALQRVSYLSTSKLGFVEALDACQRGLELRQTLADKERARRAQSPGIDFATPPIMRRFIEST